MDQTFTSYLPTHIEVDCDKDEEELAEEKQMMLECIEMLAFDEMMQSIVAMVDEYMPPPLENEE